MRAETKMGKVMLGAQPSSFAKIEFVVTDEIEELLRKATLTNLEKETDRLARLCFLQGLSGYFQYMNDDENAKKVEAFINRIEKL